MLHVILYRPEIPPNTGNVIRLCANAGADLHLIHPLGFGLDDARLRRAGLDYRELACVHEHAGLDECLDRLGSPRVFGFTTRAKRSHASVRYRTGDALLFGPETRGLPDRILESLAEECRLRIPMRAGSRSMNLSNAVAVAVYEAWRQLGFEEG